MCSSVWCSPEIYSGCGLCLVTELRENKMPILCVECITEFNKIDHVAEFEKELDRGSWDV